MFASNSMNLSKALILLTQLCTYSGLNRIMKPNQIKSVFGLHSISNFKNNDIETDAFEININAIVTHPDYRCESAKDDIGEFPNSNIKFTLHMFSLILALLHLFKPITFNDAVQPVCISPIDHNYEGDVAVVSGWGWTLEGRQ